MADLQDGFVMAIIPTPAGLEMVTPYDLHIHHRITSSLVISPSMLKQFASKASAHVQYKYALEALPPAYLEAWRTLNGRPMQRWIDPRVDLSQPQQLPLASTPPWVLPRMTGTRSSLFQICLVIDIISGTFILFFLLNYMTRFRRSRRANILIVGHGLLLGKWLPCRSIYELRTRCHCHGSHLL